MDNWGIIGFVNGNGNSNSPKDYSFIDNMLNLNLKLSYRLKQIDKNGKFTYSDVVEVESNNIPTEFALYQNYPNPFNPTTTIKYSVPKIVNNQSSIINLKVYDILGNEIATLVNEQKAPGNYEVQWNASGFASGVYFCRLQSEDFISVKKLLLMK
ncbi:MAG: hypothetical protein AUK34_07085 [Ignavibacteria bacterium CG2_30_36_16]|nr:T9SS type A sorting domain-containing protein [Ignavibacteria bacterium]OIP60003.1 MAG: hypothetical protein AUK34_07085 [Ignavibacteria bacterium CG2_30_36_16]